MKIRPEGSPSFELSAVYGKFEIRLLLSIQSPPERYCEKAEGAESNVKLQRRNVANALPGDPLLGQESGPSEQGNQSSNNFRIQMQEFIHELMEKLTKTVVVTHIVLSTIWAIIGVDR